MSFASRAAVLMASVALGGAHAAQPADTENGSPIDVRRVADAFEKELGSQQGSFGELKGFPTRKVDEPNEVVWELNEAVEYPNGMTAGSGTRRAPGRIILRLQAPADPDRPQQRMGSSSEWPLFFHVDSNSQGLKDLAAKALAKVR